jgi:hypothetical protein
MAGLDPAIRVFLRDVPLERGCPGTSPGMTIEIADVHVTFDDVRKFALLWPEVEDGTSYGTPALKVRKKMLVRLREDHDSLVMPGVPLDEREILIERQPKIFYFTDHYRDYPMVLICLSKAKRAIVEPLLRRHWRTLASKKTVREFDAG